MVSERMWWGNYFLNAKKEPFARAASAFLLLSKQRIDSQNSHSQHDDRVMPKELFYRAKLLPYQLPPLVVAKQWLQFPQS